MRNGSDSRVKCNRHSGCEAFLENSASLIVLAVEELIAPDDQQGIHAHAVEKMSKLARDVTASDDGNRFRHFAKLENVVAGPVRHIERGALWPAAGCEHEPVG